MQIDLSKKFWNKWFQGDYRCIKLHYFPISAVLSTDSRLLVLFFTESFHGWPLGGWPPVLDLQLSGLQGHLPISLYHGSPCGGYRRSHRLLPVDSGGGPLGGSEIPGGDRQRECDAGREEYWHPGRGVHYDRSVLMTVTNNIVCVDVSKTVAWSVQFVACSIMVMFSTLHLLKKSYYYSIPRCTDEFNYWFELIIIGWPKLYPITCLMSTN